MPDSDNHFDPLQVDLSGRNLIEASAGTGKTYTLTGLYLRFILEYELPVENILVVTFTEAATLELCDRMRGRISDLLRVLQNEGEGDPFVNKLVSKCESAGKDRQHLILLARSALRSMDLAAIYTIHGFCMRVLRENAFESNSLFDLELHPDQGRLFQETIDDFWQIKVERLPSLLQELLYYKKWNADNLAQEASQILPALLAEGTGMLLGPAWSPPDSFSTAMLDDLLALWNRERNSILEALSHKSLKKGKEWYSEANIDRWSAALDGYVLGAYQVEDLFGAFEKMSTSSLQTGTKPSQAGAAPVHRFFDQCQAWHDYLESMAAGVHRQMYDWACRMLPEKKGRSRHCSFDDLLIATRDGLRRPGSGIALKRNINRRFPAILIDEFQDTDQVQFEIFDQLCANSETALCMIGDPKQAIYGFRGADVYAYLKSAQSRKAADKHTLQVNWRSEPRLLEAVNSLFTRHSDPFCCRDIHYPPVLPAPAACPRMIEKEDDHAPLTFVQFPSHDDIEKAKRRVAEGVAAEIVRLLDQTAKGNAELVRETDEGEPISRSQLCGGDLAVLVRTHQEGEYIHQALTVAGVNAVSCSNKLIWQTQEATDLLILLTGILYYTDEARLRAALALPFFEMDAEEMARLLNNDAEWDARLRRFADYAQCWQEKGVALLFARFCREEELVPRLAGQRGGERRLTNFRHLVEILQEQVYKEHLGPFELLEWFQRHCNESESRDEHQLRLESDENLVQIITVHRSKGLEYPIVFCPYFWTASPGLSRKPSFVSYHDDQKNRRIDLGGPDFEQHWLAAKRETFAEELRLLYVALTRARNRCYVYWGDVRTSRTHVTGNSVLQYLLAEPPLQDDVIAGMTAHYLSLTTDADWPARLFDELKRAGRGSIAFVDMPLERSAKLPSLETPSRNLNGLVFRRRLPEGGTIRSFSSLLRISQQHMEQPDYDATLSEQGTVEADNGREQPVSKQFVDFPRGAKAGSCLHKIFEEYDFANTDSQGLERLVDKWLTAFGFAVDWRDCVSTAIGHIAATPLYPFEALRLNSIGRRDRLDELEFYFDMPPLGDIDLNLLFRRKAIQADSAGNAIRKLFMKGFIDLFFCCDGRYYIADYKSNHLGDSADDYQPEALRNAMLQSGYDLQYMIYVVAVHRYLSRRLPGYDYERHFGGVFYLFLRGMHPDNAKGSGIYYARPDHHEVVELNEHLLRGERR